MPQPGGDALVLLLQTLEAGIEVAPGKAEIRVEVPLIEAAEATDLATTARTSASPFQDDMIERVPLVVSVVLADRAKGERSTHSS